MESNKFKFKTIEEILNISTNVDRRILELYYNKADIFRESRELYKKENSFWLFSAISQIENTFPIWLVQSLKSNKKELLYAYKDICLSIYEDPDVFCDCDEAERNKWHKTLAGFIEHTNCYIEALRLVEADKQLEYVDNVLKKLKSSSYLYESERKMRIMMSVFVLSKFSMREQIVPLFDAIIEMHSDNHFKTNYLEAMKDVLNVFIESECIEIDKITRISNKFTKERVKTLIKAIAILILLKKDGQLDTSVLRSMLYRYASLISNKGKDNLLEKAYSNLLKTNSEQLELSWMDLEDNDIITEKRTDRVTLLCSKLANTSSQKVRKAYKYYSEKGIINLGSDINIYQVPESESKNKAFNDDILKWNRAKIWLRERLKEKVVQGETNIAKLQIMWNEVEKSFFSTPIPRNKVSIKGYPPAEGEQVLIRVTQKSAIYPYHFECVVEQPPYVGRGFINIKKTVRYHVETDIDSFQSEYGCPMLIKAKVNKIHQNDTIEFSLRENIETYIYNSVNINDTTECVISMVDNKNYTCVSKEGYGLQFYKSEVEEELSLGEIVEVKIYRKWPGGNVRGNFIRVIEDAEPIFLKDAFTNLMYHYTDGLVYEEKEKVKNATENEELKIKEFFEFVHIVDYKAMTESELSAKYNYTAFCRILSLLVEEDALANYYKMRMKLIKKLYELGLNGSIDVDELNRQLREADDILFKFPELNDMVTQFYIICLLGKSWEEGKLWMLARENDNENIQRLARLVLSYNLLNDLNVDEQREQIRSRISELLNIDVKIPMADYIGVEDETTEFKTSLVYPAGNNMQYDIEKQMNEILKVICGFLNHKGGTLYIGVNDSGYVSGLENDFRFFCKGQSGYDLVKAKDEMLNRFHQGTRRLGTLATEKITTDFVNDKYLKIEINPFKGLVKFEGQVYVRRGPTTSTVDPKDWEKIEASRHK